MKRRSPAKHKQVVTRAPTAAPAGALEPAQPTSDEESVKVVEPQEPFVADEDVRQAEDDLETHVAPERLDRPVPERRTSSPEVCGLAEDAAVPGSDLD